MQLAGRLQHQGVGALARPALSPRHVLPHQCQRLRRALPLAATPAAEAAVILTNGNGNGTGHATAAAAPFTINFPDPVLGCVPPAGAYQNNVKMGAYKAAMPAWRTFLLGIVAGCYIAFAGLLACAVAASLPGVNPGLVKLALGAVFPFGLLMVIICGAELYTGNTALLTIAVYEKKATMKDLLRNWFWSYSGNFVGSLLMVAAIAGSGILATNPVPAAMAVLKTGLPMHQVVLRAILANWLVCVAVWQANAATTLPGKMLGLWTPIMAFVAIGLEHSVANMFFIPMGIALGANVSFTHFLTSNLIPVTIGNTIGGAVFMATTYSLAYGALGKKLDGIPATA